MKTLPIDAKNLEELAELLPEQRQRFLSLLSGRKWFIKSDFEIQKKLLTLPPDFDGYLSDLTNRLEEYPGIDVIKLLDIPRGNFNLITLFEVRSRQTNQVFTYEYVSFKYGANPGFKGIILLEVHGEVKYFVIKQTQKFAIGTQTYDCIGGFVQYKNNQLLNLPKDTEEEIKKELNLKELVISRFVDLGEIYTDVGMTNNHTSLFAAIVDVSGSPKILTLKDRIINNTKKITFDVIIEPIERLGEYVHKVDDSFFLACVSRLLSKNLIRL